MKSSGAQALLEMLAASGVRYLFGNPGTTELPLMDALVGETRLQYVLGLQEVPVMAMADGYAQASRGVGVVNLHISCGLGNAMGMLYNAHRSGTPLLVTAGQTDRRIRFEEPILWSDMVRVARPWTRWSAEVDRVADLPAALRRALQIALAPPTGPVFLSIPMDVQAEIDELDVSPSAPLDCQTRPPRSAVTAAARALAEARNPGILVGSRVQEADAVQPLVEIAELLGAPAISESGTSHGRLGFPADHALSAPSLPTAASDVRARLDEFDVLLVTGMDLLRQYVFHPARAIPETTRLVHIDEDPYQIGKNYPVSVGVVGSTRAALIEIAEELRAVMSDATRSLAAERRNRREAALAMGRATLRCEADAQRDRRPLSPLALMQAVAAALPDDAAVIEEAVTTTGNYLERTGALRNTSGYFGHRGWALGWGLGCAIGVKLAWPERPVLALVGEGSAMYGIQALWTAAHRRLPVIFMICNNSQYQILKGGARALGLPAAMQGRFIGFDLREPEIDFVRLAESLGVEAVRITEPDDLTARLNAGWNRDRPLLLDVPVTGSAL